MGILTWLLQKWTICLRIPKECLNRCRDMLQLAFKDSPDNFQSSSLQMISQVHNQEANSMQKKFSTQIYDEDNVYLSPVQTWKDKSCESNHSPWKEFQSFQIPRFLHHSIPILTKILVCTQLILDEILSWIISKDREKIWYEWYAQVATLVVWFHLTLLCYHD